MGISTNKHSEQSGLKHNRIATLRARDTYRRRRLLSARIGKYVVIMIVWHTQRKRLQWLVP